MSFNSIEYILFIAIVAILYYVIPNKYQNIFLLTASYVFYVAWGVLPAFLLLAQSLQSYFAAILINKYSKYKKNIAILSIFIGLIILFIFKYFDFFFSAFGFKSLNLIVPVGVSFYTFQTIGYVLDVYREEFTPSTDIVEFLLFVSFFPQILSGPIARSNDLFYQLRRKSVFDIEDFKYFVLVFLWGLMKKMVIADNLAIIVNTSFDDISSKTGFQLLFASICYSVQIYCDFSAYSDMAIASARLFGIRLKRNFDNPYSAISIKDFWRRWHISLSSWFRDYLYIPLGGNRCGLLRQCFNLTVVFLVSGLWHGPSLTYVVWGAIHAFYQIIELLISNSEKHFNLQTRKDNYLSNDVFNKQSTWIHCIVQMAKRIITFLLVTFAFIVFRAETLNMAWDIVRSIFERFGVFDFNLLFNLGMTRIMFVVLGVVVIGLFVIERINQDNKVVNSINCKFFVRFLVYFILIMTIIYLGCYGPEFDAQEFVYFKF